jgi:hypothetical protein
VTTADPAPTTLTTAVPASTASPATTIGTGDDGGSDHDELDDDERRRRDRPAATRARGLLRDRDDRSTSGAAVAEQFPITG